MKKIAILATTLFFLVGLQAFSQTDKKAPATRKAETPANVKPQAVPATQPKAPTTAPTRPKMSKEDSIRRQHKLDSIRKVMAEKRAKEGFPKLSKEDSLKRAAKIDSLRKAAKEKQKANAGQNKKISKEDSLKRVHRLDSLRKAAAEKKVKAPVEKK